MANVFKRTGLLLAGIFLAGLLIQLGKYLFIRHFSIAQAFARPYALLLVVMVILCGLSAFHERLAWFQPLVFLLGTAAGVMTGPESYYGLGFFVIAVLLLFRLGFFQRKKALKLGVVLLYLFTLEVTSNLRAGENLVQAFTPIFYILALILMLYLAYEEKLMVYLREDKPRISLTALGFTALEKAYVFATLEGKSAKEIAFALKVTESTARNNISRSFHKLGVDDRHAFTVLSIQNDIVD